MHADSRQCTFCFCVHRQHSTPSKQWSLHPSLSGTQLVGPPTHVPTLRNGSLHFAVYISTVEFMTADLSAGFFAGTWATMWLCITTLSTCTSKPATHCGRAGWQPGACCVPGTATAMALASWSSSSPPASATKVDFDGLVPPPVLSTPACLACFVSFVCNAGLLLLLLGC